MEFDQLKAAAKAVTMPNEVKRRIVRNCKAESSALRKENNMRINENMLLFRKSSAILIALSVCLTLSVTALAASGILKGSFRDVKNWKGAVVGTAYDQASDEICMYVTVDKNEMTVLVTVVNPQMAPYAYVENLGIAEYKITDANGKTVTSGDAEPAELVNGQATISVPLDRLDKGTYKLLVKAFVGNAKADQPLKINGNWEAVFSK